MWTLATRGPESRRPLVPQRARILAQERRRWLTEVEQDEDRCLDAMLHWRDPAERSRRLHRRDHTLADDNPASG
jgi:hypothetical protein